jgi:hypothetical protein
MDASFDIRPDARANLMKVKLAGFFAATDVDRFALAYRQGLERLQGYGHLTLADIRGMKIQSQDIVAAFSSFMSSPRVRSRKLAFVCASTLARLQAERLTDRKDVKFFESPHEAEAWLLE